MAAQVTQVPDLCALYLVPVYVSERDCVYQECMKPARMWASCAPVYPLVMGASLRNQLYSGLFRWWKFSQINGINVFSWINPREPCDKPVYFSCTCRPAVYHSDFFDTIIFKAQHLWYPWEPNYVCMWQFSSTCRATGWPQAMCSRPKWAEFKQNWVSTGLIGSYHATIVLCRQGGLVICSTMHEWLTRLVAFMCGKAETVYIAKYPSIRAIRQACALDPPRSITWGTLSS